MEGRLALRVELKEKELWVEAAGGERLLSAWVRERLNASLPTEIRESHTRGEPLTAASDWAMPETRSAVVPTTKVSGAQSKRRTPLPRKAAGEGVAVAASSPKDRRGRTEMCEHRIGPDAYCARCDR